MSFQILLDDQPCGVKCLSAESAEDFIARQHPDLQKRMSFKGRRKGLGVSDRSDLSDLSDGQKRPLA